MDNLVQKLNWDMPFIKNQCMFVYAEADLDSNQKMQEPLQKLYQYENQPDMREKVREYIDELDTEIDRLEDLLRNTDSPYDLQIKGRLNAIIEVKNDLLGRLEEVIQMEIKDYLSKRIRDRVVRVDVELDFDYNKNRR